MTSKMTILLAVLVAGCNAPSPAPSGNSATAAAPGRDYVRAVEALSPQQRNGVLLKAINDAGLTCQNVSDSVRVEASAGRARWRAHCTDDTDHLVEIAPDGNALVISRRED